MQKIDNCQKLQQILAGSFIFFQMTTTIQLIQLTIKSIYLSATTNQLQPILFVIYILHI